MQRIAPSLRLPLLLVVGLIARIAFMGNGGFSIDVGDFQAWATMVTHQPLDTFYNGAGFADYPPGYLYVLMIVGHIYSLLAPAGNSTLFLYLIKAPAVLADLADAYLIYLVVRRYASEAWALGAAAMVALNPAIIAVSAAWGQVDSITAGLALLGIYLLLRASDDGDDANGYVITAWLALAASVLMKPQAAVLAPLFIAFAFTSRERIGQRVIATGAGIVAAFILAFIAARPFHPIGGVLETFAWLWHIYAAGYGAKPGEGYAYSSVNAFNLWSVARPFWQTDQQQVLIWTQQRWGDILFIAAGALIVWRYLQRRTGEAFLEACALVSLAFFILMTRMHERYVFDAVLFLCATIAIARRYLAATIVVSFTMLANLIYSLEYLAATSGKLPGVNAVDIWGFPDHLLSAINVATLFFLAYVYLSDNAEAVLGGLSRFSFAWPTLRTEVDPEAGTRGMNPLDHLVAGAITLGSFIVLFINYWLPAEKIFDEIYFARAAEEYLTRNYIYESTHPPTTKLLITLSTMMFGGMAHGDNSWGWRFLNVVAGALVVWVLYVLAKRVTGSTLFAACAAFLLACDGQHFVQSRIATPEAFVALFSLLSIYAFYRFWLASQDRATPVVDRATIISRIVGTLGAIALGIGVVLLHFASEAFGAKIVVTVYFATGFYLVYRAFVEPRLRGKNLKFDHADIWLGLFALFAALLVTSKWYGVMAYGVAIVIVFGVRAQAYFETKTWGNPFSFRLDVIFCAVLFALGSIYALSYTPHFFGLKDQPTWPPKSYSVTDIVDMQVGAFEYHDHLKATHPYQSVWWQWPIDARPVMYYANYTGINESARSAVIYTLPNPIILWFGLLAVPLVGLLAWREKNKGYALIVVAYLAQWLPWIYSPRIAWNYHFYVNIALICLCNAIILQRAWQRGWKVPAAIYVGLVAAAFIFFYPVLAGVPEPNWAWQMRQWFPSWV